MAMTVAFVPNAENVSGKYKENIVDFTLDASYPKNATNGYPLPLAVLGFKQLMFFAPVSNGTAGGGFDYIFDTTNITLRVFVSSTSVEVADGASLAGVVVRCLVVGQ